MLQRLLIVLLISPHLERFQPTIKYRLTTVGLPCPLVKVVVLCFLRKLMAA